MLTVQDEQKFNTYLRSTLIVIIALLLLANHAVAQTVGGIISRIGDTTHLELRGRKEWNYESPKKDKNTITMTVPAFDDVTVVQLQAWTCPLIKEIKVDKNGADGRYTIQFTLQSDSAESFDYLTDDPSYLVVDFFEPNKANETGTSAAANSEAAPAQNAQVASGKLPEKVDPTKATAKKKNRKPASSELLTVADANPAAAGDSIKIVEVAPEEKSNIQYERGVFDGGDPDYNRFRLKDYEKNEEALIASQNNIYLSYPMLYRILNRFQELQQNPPEYEILPKETDENKEARFLHTLYKNKRYGSYFESLKYFNTKRLNSEYDEIVKNMTADMHLQLFSRDKDAKDLDAARAIYLYLLEKYPESILTERNSLMLAYSYLDQKDGSETIRYMQKFLDQFPKSDERDNVRLAMAEAYNYMNKPKDAIRTYSGIIRDVEDKKYVVEAAYRIGDVYARQKDYQKAVDAYSLVQKQYPLHKPSYPNAQYNLAESLFWLKKYDESLNAYIDFLKIFPSHRHGGFALTRIGELLEMNGAPEKKVQGAFVEGYFRFPESQGSEVSRIRMLSRELDQMTDREKKRSVAEINEIAARSELPRIQEFATLMKADGLSSRKENKESLDLLLSYYQQNPTTADIKTFKGRIQRNISDILQADTNQARYIDALNFYGKYSTTWLKNTDRIDVRYYQAYAFEKSGVVRESEKIYTSLLKDLATMKNTREDKERKVYENHITADQLNLRLAATALQQKKYRESFARLGQIQSPLPTADDIERVQIGAEVAEQMGETKQAISFLEKLAQNYASDKRLMIPPLINLVRLYIKDKNIAAAEQRLNALEQIKQSDVQYNDSDWAKTMQLRGDTQLAAGQRLAAVETYTKLLDQFENQIPLAAVRYKTGKILYDDGDLKGAEKIWTGLNGGTGEFYKKMATEKLIHAGWSDTYKKYVERIPAAEQLK